mgnify:CR=1 FL=1
MDAKVYTQSGDVVGTIGLSDRIFNATIKVKVLREAVLAQEANSRQVTAHTKGRGEVRGGGKKPWRQKGTGRARHASIRSPIWKGGGVAHGPKKERNFSVKINKKFKRAALHMALSSKVRDNEFAILDALALTEIKTRLAAAALKTFVKVLPAYRSSKKGADSILFVVPQSEATIPRVLHNIPRVTTIAAGSLNVRDILTNKYLVIFKDAVPFIETTYK